MMFYELWFWWIMRDCPHPTHRVWCIHGDKIRLTGYKRSVCMDCYRYWPTLPDWCSSASIREGRYVSHNS